MRLVSTLLRQFTGYSSAYSPTVGCAQVLYICLTVFTALKLEESFPINVMRVEVIKCFNL